MIDIEDFPQIFWYERLERFCLNFSIKSCIIKLEFSQLVTNQKSQIGCLILVIEVEGSLCVKREKVLDHCF